MKQLEATEFVVAGTKFYVRPFPAFKAANISGELASVLTPFLGALAPLIDTKKGDTGERESPESTDKGLDDIDAGEAAKAMSAVNISGAQIEKLMKKLLLGGHIAYEAEDDEGNTEAKKLEEDDVNELFCGDVQDMYILCFDVIKVNFNGFFKKFAGLSGAAKATVAKKLRKKL